MATALAHAGEDVVLLVRRQTRKAYKGAIHLERPYETIEVRVKVETRLAIPVDVLLVAVNKHQLATALRKISPSARIASIAPPAQWNCTGFAVAVALRPRSGRAGDDFISSERVALGRVIQHSPFAKLTIPNTGEQRLRGIAERLQSVGFFV